MDRATPALGPAEAQLHPGRCPAYLRDLPATALACWVSDHPPLIVCRRFWKTLTSNWRRSLRTCKAFLARAMLEALIQGETDAAVLADLALGRPRGSRPSWRWRWSAGSGSITASCGANSPDHLDTLNQELATLHVQIRGLTAPQAAIIERLDAIPGIDRRTAEVILAEIGPDVDALSDGAALGFLGLSLSGQQHHRR